MNVFPKAIEYNLLKWNIYENLKIIIIILMRIQSWSQNIAISSSYESRATKANCIKGDWPLRFVYAPRLSNVQNFGRTQKNCASTSAHRIKFNQEFC